MSKLRIAVVIIAAIFFSCAKETSVEGLAKPAIGTLQSNISGECLPKLVAGSYQQGIPLDPANNYIEVSLHITRAGYYNITTDTVNGLSFQTSADFIDTGLHVVRLPGNGTPLLEGTHELLIRFGTSLCALSISTEEATTGPAVFVLTGAPGPCGAPNVQGTYAAGVALNSDNKVALHINATAIGSFSITTTPVNGISFSGSGSITATGPQTITLAGSGTPISTGLISIPVTAGSSSCSFPVNVTGSSTFTLNCAGSIVQGNYVTGVQLNATNTITIPVTVNTIGTYSISASINGMTFTGSGTFPAIGPWTVQLIGSGIPVNAGNYAITISVASGSCPIGIAITEPTASGDFSFTAEGITYTGTINTIFIDNITTPPELTMTVWGTTANNDFFGLLIRDISGAINAEDYPMAFPGAPVAMNLADFSFAVQGSPVKYYGSPLFPTNTMLLKILSHNVATKTITGTFAGGAINQAGAGIPITNGAISITYD